MTIWILALLLFGLCVWLGLLQGAIRTTVLVIGLILGAILAVPLAPLVRPLFPLVGVTNPVWNWLFPPLLVFVLIQILAEIVAFVVHRQVALHYKYKTDDVQLLRWERLNKHLGACVGLLAGFGYLLVIGVVIYVAGYLTVQVASAETAPTTLRVLNRARADLRTTGLEKMVARLDPMPRAYYEGSDVIGLTYNNPLLHGRLASYPAFLSLGERAEFQDIATDTELNQTLQSQENVIQVINHPKVQTILKNKEIVDEFSKVDLKDLHEHLVTGTSPKFEEEKLLGRWELAMAPTMTSVKSVLTNVPVSVFNNVRKALSLSDMTLVATPDHKAYLKIQAKDEIQQLATAPPVAVTAGAPMSSDGSPQAPRPGTAPTARSIAARADPNNTDDRFAQRYGVQRPNAGAPPPAFVAPVPAAKPPPPSPILKLVVYGEGAWKKEDDRYQITIQHDGKDHEFEGQIREGTLVLAKDGFRLNFERE